MALKPYGVIRPEMNSARRCVFLAATCLIAQFSPGLVGGHESASTFELLPFESIRAPATAYQQVNVSPLVQETARFMLYSLYYKRSQGRSPSSNVRSLFIDKTIPSDEAHQSRDKASLQSEDYEVQHVSSDRTTFSELFPETATKNERSEHIAQLGPEDQGETSERAIVTEALVPHLLQSDNNRCAQNMLNFQELERMSMYGSLSNLTTSELQIIRGNYIFGSNVSCPQSSSVGVPFIIIFPITFLGNIHFLRDLLTFDDLIFDRDELERAVNSSFDPAVNFSLPAGLIVSLGIPNLQTRCVKDGRLIQRSVHLFLGGGFTSSYLDEISGLLSVDDDNEPMFMQDSALIASFTSGKKIRILAVLQALLRLVAPGNRSSHSSPGPATDHFTSPIEDYVSTIAILRRELDPHSLCFYSNVRDVFERAAFNMAMQLRVLSIFPPFNANLSSHSNTTAQCRNESLEVDLIGIIEDGNVEAKITLNGRTCDSPARFYRVDGNNVVTEGSIPPVFPIMSTDRVSNYTYLANGTYITEAYSDPTCGITEDSGGISILFSSTGDGTYHGRVLDHGASSVCEYSLKAKGIFGIPVATDTPDIEVSPEITAAPTPSVSVNPLPASRSESPRPSNSTGGVLGEVKSCFPADAIVEMQSGKLVPMAKLQVGDRVRVGPKRLSTVIMFSHRDLNALAVFVRLDTSDRTTIHMSPAHYIYVNGRIAVASAVQVGDALTPGREGAGSITVINTSYVYKRGLFNPQTTQGDIVVNGIITSTFTAALPITLARALLAPLSAVNRMFGLVIEPISSLFAKGAPLLADLFPCGPAVYTT